jgi:hypothetical protein
VRKLCGNSPLPDSVRKLCGDFRVSRRATARCLGVSCRALGAFPSRTVHCGGNPARRVKSDSGACPSSPRSQTTSRSGNEDVSHWAGQSGATAPPARPYSSKEKQRHRDFTPRKEKAHPLSQRPESDRFVTGHNQCKNLKSKRFGFATNRKSDRFAVSMSEDLSERAEFINEKQLLARLPISRRTLGYWKANGTIPFIKIGRRCLYDWPSVQGALLRRQRGGP